MNNNLYSEKNSKFFYAILALSVLAVIAAAVGITSAANKIRSEKNEPTQTSIDWDNHSGAVIDEEANKEETGIKDDRTSEDEDDTDETEMTEDETDNESTTRTAAATQKNIECSLPMGTSILKDYSNATMVKSKTMNDWRTHNGVDFTGEIGDEVHAVCGGKVTKVESEPSWGNVVYIDHDNGLTAKYCGLDEVTVNEGDRVSINDVIGSLGVIPIESADASHLHFEVTQDGKYVDPIDSLSLQREEE